MPILQPAVPLADQINNADLSVGGGVGSVITVSRGLQPMLETRQRAEAGHISRGSLMDFARLLLVLTPLIRSHALRPTGSRFVLKNRGLSWIVLGTTLPCRPPEPLLSSHIPFEYRGFGGGALAGSLRL